MANAPDTGFQASSESSLEQKIISHICQPVLERVPRSIHPNTLSLVTHLLAWMSAASGFASARFGPIGRALALIGAGIGSFLVMVGDCLDGMQARRTNRCSKLGELLDHWLDAAAVPLVTLGVVSALQLDPWLAALVHVTNTMVYNGQLVLFHHSGKFAGTTGVDALVGVSILYVGFAVLFSLVERSTRWLDITVMVMGIVAVLIQLRINGSYYRRMGRLVIHHLPFVLLCGGAVALLLTGMIDLSAFLLLIVFLSFRINGGYVQATLVGRRFSGFDPIAALLLVGVAAVHTLVSPIEIGGYQLRPFLPYAVGVYLVGRNLVEFALELHAFRPAPAKQS